MVAWKWYIFKGSNGHHGTVPYIWVDQSDSDYKHVWKSLVLCILRLTLIVMCISVSDTDCNKLYILLTKLMVLSDAKLENIPPSIRAICQSILEKYLPHAKGIWMHHMHGSEEYFKLCLEVINNLKWGCTTFITQKRIVLCNLSWTFRK